MEIHPNRSEPVVGFKRVMGSGLSYKKDISNLEEYLERHLLGESEVRKHGWERHNTSQHLAIEPDGITVKKTTNSKHKEVSVGKISYTQGVHVFEFDWASKPESHCSIGIALEDIKVHNETDEFLLGNDDLSVAYVLTTHSVIFNGCPIKQLPQFSNPSAFNLPKIIRMVLDMDHGTLCFKTGTEYEMAMRGLKHISQTFFVATCLDTKGDSVRLRYLGNSDLALSEELSAGDDTPLRFHDMCGKNIQLSGNNLTAQRKRPRETFNHATVMSNRPLQEGELFKISIKELDSVKWSGSIIMGITNLSPLSLNFVDWMPTCTQGKICIYRDKKIVENGGKETDAKTDLDFLQEGSTIGLCRRNGKVEFYVNGIKETTYAPNIKPDEEVYGVADLYGQAIAITLLSVDIRSHHDAADLKGQIISGKGRIPKRRVFLNAVEETLKHMQLHDEGQIPQVEKLVENNIIYPFVNVDDIGLKEEVTQAMVTKKACATIKGYLQFLDLSSSGKTGQCFQKVLEMCELCFKIDLSLCRDAERSGLLQYIIKALKNLGDKWKKDSILRSRAQSLLKTALYCSLATENKAVFKDNDFSSASKRFKDDQKLGIDVLLILAHIYGDSGDGQFVEASSVQCKGLSTLLQRAVMSGTYEGYTDVQLAKAVTDLVACAANIGNLIENDIVKHLVHMIVSNDKSRQECALNAVWSLTEENTHNRIRDTVGLMPAVRSNELSNYPEVKQATTRLLVKLEKLAVATKSTLTASVKVRSECEYAKLCMEFKKSLNLNEGYFDDKLKMCYCDTCHANRGDKGYYPRGQPSKLYGLPIGWFRFALHTNRRVTPEGLFDKWHRAYHGTKKEYLQKILLEGNIVPAGDKVIGGKKIKEEWNHFSDDQKPDGFNTKQVFLSPSIRYSGVDTYAAPSKFTSKLDMKTYRAKVALLVLIEPNSYTVGKETIGAVSEIDPSFSNDEIEWMTDIRTSMEIYGLLVKLY